tara:strand:- start:101 stop:1948 length:1848 start_codon:yes stop_codon:yes gene_type:complete
MSAYATPPLTALCAKRLARTARPAPVDACVTYTVTHTVDRETFLYCKIAENATQVKIMLFRVKSNIHHADAWWEVMDDIYLLRIRPIFTDSSDNEESGHVVKLTPQDLCRVENSLRRALMNLLKHEELWTEINEVNLVALQTRMLDTTDNASSLCFVIESALKGFTDAGQVKPIEGDTYGVLAGTLIWTYKRPSAVADNRSKEIQRIKNDPTKGENDALLMSVTHRKEKNSTNHLVRFQKKKNGHESCKWANFTDSWTISNREFILILECTEKDVDALSGRNKDCLLGISNSVACACFDDLISQLRNFHEPEGTTTNINFMYTEEAKRLAKRLADWLAESMLQTLSDRLSGTNNETRLSFERPPCWHIEILRAPPQQPLVSFQQFDLPSNDTLKIFCIGDGEQPRLQPFCNAAWTINSHQFRLQLSCTSEAGDIQGEAPTINADHAKSVACACFEDLIIRLRKTNATTDCMDKEEAKLLARSLKDWLTVVMLSHLVPVQDFVFPRKNLSDFNFVQPLLNLQFENNKVEVNDISDDEWTENIKHEWYSVEQPKFHLNFENNKVEVKESSQEENENRTASKESPGDTVVDTDEDIDDDTGDDTGDDTDEDTDDDILN